MASSPHEIIITLRHDEQMHAMARKIRELTAELTDMEAQRNRAEYKYRCESVINGELTDLLRQHGIAYRAALAARPWGDDTS